MRKQDNPKFNELLAILEETFKPFSEAKKSIWAAVLKNHKIEDFENAVMNHISDPIRGSYENVKPADILRFMPEPEQAMMIEDKGGLSWCPNTQKLIDKYCPEQYKLKVNI